MGLLSQNTIGFPEIINYSKKQYNAGVQNWNIVQDKDGIIYIANNEGLLTFDGRNWLLYPLPNKTIVRSVAIGDDGRIYVGGQDELGYFSPNANGRLVFTSLKGLFPSQSKSFGDVWNIVNYNKAIYFRTTYQIFRYASEKIDVFQAPFEYGYMETCNGKLLAYDHQIGLLYFSKQNWIPLLKANAKTSIPKGDAVTAILSVDESSMLITTLKNGIYLLREQQLEKVQSPINTLLSKERIYAATAINNEWVALATTNGGVYIIDRKGNLIQHFSRSEGMQNNNVLSIFLDKEKNLWLGLNNGIDFIAYNSAIKNISAQLNEESGYAAVVHNKQLYLGTSNGLYTVPLQPASDISFSKGQFKLVANTGGQNWVLQTYQDRLFLGHHEGAFEIKDQTAISMGTPYGFWNFTPYGNGIIAGNYNGLYLIEGKQQKALAGFTESSRFVAVDSLNNTWVSHPYHGVFKISPDFVTYGYGKEQGLPSELNSHVFTIGKRILFATEKGIYVYNYVLNRFERDAFYDQLLGNQSIRYLKQDQEGNLWFIHEKNLGVIDMSGAQPQVINIPELKNKMLSGFEMIYPVNEQNIFLGGEKGFYHINYSKYKKNPPTIMLQVRSVRIGNNLDSLVFGGYFNTLDKPAVQTEESIPSINYSYNSIRIDYAASQHGYMANLEYSFRMSPFENSWSAWTSRTEKEYTNLPPGNYTFEVKARNNLGSESAVAVYQLSIKAPWYRTIWAMGLYLLTAITFILGLYQWQKKKFIQQNLRYKEEQKKLVYIHELEINKNEGELVALRNEKLESDLHFKNTELASSAMHLVKKGELLTKLKNELTHISKKIDNEYAITELKKTIKTLSEDEHLDEEWEYFTKHFDKVHSDFILSLKSTHPGISNSELKLCAFLRMNLSTKEIAQLLNISVRGVEISRYRLRKKLNLATEVSLFDYLIQIGKQG